MPTCRSLCGGGQRTTLQQLVPSTLQVLWIELEFSGLATRVIPLLSGLAIQSCLSLGVLFLTALRSCYSLLCVPSGVGFISEMPLSTFP